jgi:ADP-ribose pyrophosphatase YjhB (NUDIX family)
MQQPDEKIRVIAIALIFHKGRLLVEAVHHPDRSIKGWRPPGGGMEFGERAEDTLVREFQEEFGVLVKPGKRVAVFENHFIHGPGPGHEIVFVHQAMLVDDALTLKDEFTFNENGATALARWIETTRFQSGAETLYPHGLLPFLQ